MQDSVRAFFDGAATLTQYHLAALILAMIGPLLALARRLHVPGSMLLFGVGVASTAIPGLPPPSIDPDLVMTLCLPPLLYASTARVSWHLLRFTLLPGVLLGSLAVVLVVVVVAVAVRAFLLPGLGWPAAVMIGLAAAFFDTRLFHEAQGRPHIQRAIADTLKAREISSRIIILAMLGLVQDRLTSSSPVAHDLVANFLIGIPGGACVGFMVAHATLWLRRKIDPAAIEIAVSIATPFISMLAAEAAGLSVAASIITSALVVSACWVNAETGTSISSNEARINATAFWEEASLIVSSVVFLLAGRAVPAAIGAVADWRIWQIAVTAAGMLLIAGAIEFMSALAATRLEPMRSALADTGRRTAAAAVMSWSSTRSVIALILALSIPATLPNGSQFAQRDLILAVITVAVIGSVVMQGLTLKWMVVRASLTESSDEEAEEAAAAEALRGADKADDPDQAAAAARQELLRLRGDDVIGDEVMARTMREADLGARAAEKDAMPGSGPPQP